MAPLHGIFYSHYPCNLILSFGKEKRASTSPKYKCINLEWIYRNITISVSIILASITEIVVYILPNDCENLKLLVANLSLFLSC